MNLSKFFIDRPIFAGVISVLMVLAGLIAVRGLPISEYPEVVPPSVVVRAQYPGANPKVIAETVATPLEEALNGVEGMLIGIEAGVDRADRHQGRQQRRAGAGRHLVADGDFQPADAARDRGTHLGIAEAKTEVKG